MYIEIRLAFTDKEKKILKDAQKVLYDAAKQIDNYSPSKFESEETLQALQECCESTGDNLDEILSFS